MPAPDPTSLPSLRAAGMRQTPQRQHILSVLQSVERPVTVEEIFERLPKGRSGLPTIYRNLERFIAEGWVESVLGEDQVMRFVRCHSPHHHHHVQCEGCARVVEVDGCALGPGLQAMEAQSGFRITRHKLMLFGLCPACAEKER
jgi:Fur family ferric uptake transcriptional regulator